MEWPICRLCEVKHNPKEWCPSSALDAIAPSEEVRSRAEKVLGVGIAPIPVVETVSKVGVVKRRAKKGTFDRKTYMREFMRRKRAKEKSAG